MTFANVLSIAVIALYLLGAGMLFVGVLKESSTAKKLAYCLTGSGFFCHTTLLVVTLFAGRAEVLAQSNFYISLLAWSVVLIYFVIWWKLRLQFLGLGAAPLALTLYLSAYATTGVRVSLPAYLSGLFFGLHIGTLFIAISLLTMACAAGVMYLYLERKIKTKEKLAGFAKALPSLSAIDRANQWAVVVGFPLYTLGLVTGFIWAGLTWNKVFSWDPKEVVAVIIWLLFAFLFHQRTMLGWQGRKTAWLAIWVFALTFLSMLGINFLLPTHHSFAA
ncbi:cytochrome C assembly family protein [Desulfovibrio inopinatus]|uniref:cytochrome C assembly family protein n=1 Tax=Desulfovibrio inopinatus TaxID=102109 RepID=UPI0003FD647E|nr:cytochrome c biogenesis protein CcsA [Desulfovibrio inopinatus]